MVESPTYFNSTHPVLTAMQETNIEGFGLFRQIVFAESEPRPEPKLPPVTLQIASGEI